VCVYGNEILGLLPRWQYNLGKNGKQSSMGIPHPIHLAWRNSCGSTCNLPIIVLEFSPKLEPPDFTKTIEYKFL
jgi:hypothetical protein